MKDSAIVDLRKDPIISNEVFWVLLDDAGHSNLVYPPNKPRPLFLDERKRSSRTRGFVKHPILADLLRAVARVCSPPPPQPFHRTSPVQLNDDHLPEGPVNAQSPPPEMVYYDSTALAASGASVVFGPVVWYRQHVDEFRVFVEQWRWNTHHRMSYNTWKSLQVQGMVQACQLMPNHLKGDGYAVVQFTNADYAQLFVKEWKQNPLEGYESVVAEIWDGGGMSLGHGTEEQTEPLLATGSGSHQENHPAQIQR
ncbi:hypothetical protein K488DRAFT_92560 [Vararia minispora EC-137]|uniref:Uncharacterized protein n=1 Tax=Vararia minispora EC-137 TaxID=1314806 RepID=A0ACB8Q4D6_9AGAM|nr:hypothetical protein K488DRAFT_92560 [Vararia minispora EC-137]